MTDYNDEDAEDGMERVESPQDEFAELNELLTPATDTAREEFGDLNDLLAESMETAKSIAMAKESRERIRRGGQGERERREDEARLREWEAKHEWMAEANVAVFDRQACGCGVTNEVFAGFMQRERHRHLRTGMRWMIAGEAKASLPNEVIVRTKVVAMCGTCAGGKGWPVELATEWKDR